jgi:hypothetical protein
MQCIGNSTVSCRYETTDQPASQPASPAACIAVAEFKVQFRENKKPGDAIVRVCPTPPLHQGQGEQGPKCGFSSDLRIQL